MRWIRAGGGCLREGWGNCLKYFKRGWNRKEERSNKDIKNGGKLGQGVGVLKRGLLETLYKLWEKGKAFPAFF